MAKKGLAQANTLRSNNIGKDGYAVAYADEIAGHKSVERLEDLYALYPWVLSVSGINDHDDAIGQLWWVVDPKGDNSKEGCFYQLKDWENRQSAEGWKKFETGGSSIDTSDFLSKAKDAVTNTDIDNLWTTE